MNWNEFQCYERASRQRVDFQMAYVDMTGDLVTGLLLSQIVYWNLPGKDGKPKLKVHKRGCFWLAKSRHDWWDEVRLSPKQVSRALAELRKKGLIETKLFKFNGAPTTHIRLLVDSFTKLYEQTIGTNGFVPKVTIQYDQRSQSITETTTETTTEDTELCVQSSQPSVLVNPPVAEPMPMKEITREEISEKEPDERPPHGAYFTALKTVCKMDASLKSNRGRLNRVAKEVRDSGNYTPEDILELYSPGGWWYESDFRGEGRPPPKPEDVPRTLMQATENVREETGPWTRICA